MPDSTVMLKTHIAVMTIHMIGNSPKAAPSRAANPVWSAGMPYTLIATAIATPNAISAAHCDRIFKPPSNTKRVKIGSAANIAVRASDPDIGVKSW